MFIFRNFRSYSARFVLLSVAIGCCMAADWPQFRGPNGSGATRANTKGPITWTASENVIWKADSPGFGASSPVMKGDRIYVSGYYGYGADASDASDIGKLMYRVACYNRDDGAVMWHHEIQPVRSPKTQYHGMAALHGYASPSPVVDDQNAYVFFGNSGVYAFTLGGQLLWHADAGEGTHTWNCGASLIAWDNLVIVNASVESRSIIALDKRTGQQVWVRPGIDSSWATPLVVGTASGGQELVVSMKNWALGLDPASGDKLWECESVQDYVCPAVIAHKDVAFITGGRKPYFMAIRTGGRGDVTASKRIWNVRETTKVSTPIYHDGYLYFVDNKGTAACLDAETGEVQYEERLGLSGNGDKLYSSPVEMGGCLYYFSREDGCVVLAATPEFKRLAQNYLGDNSVFNATPIADRGHLIVRSDRHVYCIGQK